MEKVYAVYILTNRYNRVLYTGVTSDLRTRMYQHREKLMPGFTSRWQCHQTCLFEAGHDALGTIAREKQIKAGSRRKKVDLINTLNPEWRGLCEELQFD